MIPYQQKALHKFRGACMITPICDELQRTNPDDTSMYVEFEPGEPEEVTRALVKRFIDPHYLLSLWMEGSAFISGELEEKAPILKRARTLTGEYLHEHETDRE